MIAREFWIVQAITGAAGLLLQCTGLHAACVTFGGWVALSLYAVGGLAMLLQHVVMRRLTSCSSGA